LHEQGGRFSAAVSVLESLLDHEVSFAISPTHAELEETLLRLTGSHVAAPSAAAYVLAFGEGVTAALESARIGEPEYPDRGATVVVCVGGVSQAPGAGHPLTLSGPGIRGSARVWVQGFEPAAIEVLKRRNSELPLGLDLTLVAPDGAFTCIGRYTTIQEGL
jgi:alpha-D-ribose 1-methylphosphonate 5-triphosphate synthase subunit PhnH